MRKPRSTVRLLVEELEIRIVPANPVTVPLDPTLDQFGDQVATVQAYGDTTRLSLGGIFDTGASAITFAPDDADLFTYLGNPIPIKVPGGADAGGIGGEITGDVSQPGTIIADGFHAVNLTFDAQGFPNFGASFDGHEARTTGIQAFVGTQAGSPSLPTITGTPILNPSPDHPGGLAARIDLQGYQLDLSSLITGLVLPMPDLHFVDPGTALQGGTGLTDPVYVPMGTFGSDNHANPGNVITESRSPMQNDVGVYNTFTSGASTQALHNHFLLDTGSQLTVISTAVATQLGLDLSHPDTTIDVQGVAGTETVPGFTISKIELPTTDPNTVVDFTNVPIYVLDVAPGVDGLLGMNLFDTASSMLYDPFNPAGSGTLGLTFNTDPNRGSDLSAANLSYLNSHGLSFFTGIVAGHAIPGFAAAPTASFAAVTPSIRNTAVASIQLTFDEAVTGVSLSDLQLTNNTANVSLSSATLTTSDNLHWTVGNLTGLTGTDGTYQLTLSATSGLIKNHAGQPLASGATQSWTMDTVKPTVSIGAPSRSFASSGQTISYTITYTDANFKQSTLSTGDIMLQATGTASGQFAVTGTGATRTVTISNIAGDGSLDIALAAGTASDLAGNLAPAAGPSTPFTVNGSGTLSPATVLAIAINGIIPGDGVASDTYTQITYAGSLGLGGATLQLTHLAATAVGTTFTIIHATTPGSHVSGTFAGLAEGAMVFAPDGTAFTISYQANGGADVRLTQIAPVGTPYAYDPATQTLTIAGTTGSDWLVFGQTTADLGAEVIYTFSMNGATTALPDRQLKHVVVNGNGGTDNALLYTQLYATDSIITHEVPVKEQLLLGNSHNVLQKFDANNRATDFLTLSGFTNYFAYMNTASTATLYDAAGKLNAYYSYGTFSYLVGPGYFDFVWGPSATTAIAQAGSQDATDQFDGSGICAFTVSGHSFSEMSGLDQGRAFDNKAMGFLTNVGIANHAGDTAYVSDAPGNDVFSSYAGTDGPNRYSGYSALYGLNPLYYDLIAYFSIVNAYSFVGGLDSATNNDPAHVHVAGFGVQH